MDQFQYSQPFSSVGLVSNSLFFVPIEAWSEFEVCFSVFWSRNLGSLTLYSGIHVSWGESRHIFFLKALYTLEGATGSRWWWCNQEWYFLPGKHQIALMLQILHGLAYSLKWNMNLHHSRIFFLPVSHLLGDKDLNLSGTKDMEGPILF
jgi:hypothetical protein